MDSRQHHKRIIQEIQEVARDIVSSKIDPLIGSKIIYSLSVTAGVASEEVFKFFYTVATESEHLTLNDLVESQHHYSLEAVNLELQEYINSIQQAANEACRVLINLIEESQAA